MSRKKEYWDWVPDKTMIAKQQEAECELIALLALIVKCRREMVNGGQLCDTPFVCNEDLLLKQGRWFKQNPAARPTGLRMGKMGECYANAGRAALSYKWEGELVYVEGYALIHDLCVPVEHAWLADREGNAIDTTWRGVRPTAYLGLAFTPDYLAHVTCRNRYWGLLADYHGEWPLLTGRVALADALDTAWMAGLRRPEARKHDELFQIESDFGIAA